MKNNNILKLQFLVVFSIFIVIIISLVLLYNEILKSEGNEGFIAENDVLKLNILIRSVYFISAIFFLYVVLNNNSENSNIELIISIFSLLATSLSLYLAYTQYKDKNDNIFENDVVF